MELSNQKMRQRSKQDRKSGNNETVEGVKWDFGKQSAVSGKWHF